jgi:hypothetical protein
MVPKFVAAPVQTVMMDQNVTAMAETRRAPNRSSNHPQGTKQTIWVHPYAENIQPIVAGLQ